MIEHILPEDTPVTESIATLQRERFVLPQPPRASRYLFRHALIQEVAYHTQLEAQRRTTHGALGEAIETIYADRLDEFVNVLAFHYGRSDNDPKALHWLVRAGRSGQNAVREPGSPGAVRRGARTCPGG